MFAALLMSAGPLSAHLLIPQVLFDTNERISKELKRICPHFQRNEHISTQTHACGVDLAGEGVAMNVDIRGEL